jgi:hypothetical protein
MSTGQWLGGAVGAILGAVLGSIIPGVGTLLGAYIGGVLGYMVGGYIDPVKPDTPSPGIQAQQLEVMSNILGQPIADCLGTSKFTGFLLAYGNESKNLTGYRSHGQTVYTGYQYYATWAVGVVIGPVDMIYTIFKDEKIIWSGELACPVSGGVETIMLENIGSVDFYFGTNDQAPNATMAAIIGDATLNSPFRGLCWALFKNCLIGENFNRIPTMRFLVRKTPALTFSDKHLIQTLDYNPAHAIWHILTRMVGLPEDWLHDADFLSVAATLYAESRGISINFSSQKGADSWLETLQAHTDSILRYGSDGTFHPKLIRNDYDVADLELVDESILQEEPAISRPSWIDTIGELKVEYSDIPRPTEDDFITEALWAWFRNNEGSGIIATDHSLTAINGGLVKGFGAGNADATQQNYFWNTNSGFGTGSVTGAIAARIARLTSPKKSTYISLVAFIKPLGGSFFGDAQQAVQLGHSGLINYLSVGWQDSVIPADRKLGFNFSQGWKLSTYPLTYGQWYCIYAYSKGGLNDNGLYVRKSGDPDWVLALQNQGIAAGGGDQSGVYMFGSTNNPISMEGGDALYYIGPTSVGLITLAQATAIFQSLKAHHGMT